MTLIIVLILVLLIILSFLMGNIFTKIMVLPRTRSPEESRLIIINRTGKDPKAVMEGHRTEPFIYHSEFGYDLKGNIINADEKEKCPDGRKRVVILSHGWKGNHMTMLTYGKLYQELGFDIVSYDHRYHGDNEHNQKTIFCSMGLCESKDLIGIFKQLKPLFPSDTIWGLQGESMGSATAMQAAPEMSGLSFLVEDCGYSNLRKQMAHSLKSRHLPVFPILYTGSFILKRKYKLDMSEVNAVKSMEKLDIPTLFCHGDNDTFVPTKMIKEVYAAKKDKKRMQLFSGSAHAESIWDHPELYKSTLESFLKDYGLNRVGQPR